jgi:hypothetical protein
MRRLRPRALMAGGVVIGVTLLTGAPAWVPILLGIGTLVAAARPAGSDGSSDSSNTGYIGSDASDGDSGGDGGGGSE